jgi:hypothetical protein
MVSTMFQSKQTPSALDEQEGVFCLGVIVPWNLSAEINDNSAREAGKIFIGMQNLSDGLMLQA